MNNRYKKTLLLAFLFLPASAFAYLDPGTGTALLNVIIAGGVALIYSLKGLVLRIVKKNGKGKKEGGNRPTKKKSDVDKIAIFSEGKMYWNSYKEIVNELIESKVDFSYYTLDVEDPALLIDNEYMNSKFLGYGVKASSRFIALKSDILLTTTPNIGAQGYIARPNNVKDLVHFFHAVDDISSYKKHSLDYYDTVLLGGDYQIDTIRELEQLRNLKEKELISLGLPYLDDLASAKEDHSENSDKKVVLVASSWGEKGLLSYYGVDFIKELAKENYKIIIRPHPQSYKVEKELIDKLKKATHQIPNIQWDETTSPSWAMNISDVLVSDTSSIRHDYAFIYEKPVITLEIPSESMTGYEWDDLDKLWIEETIGEIGYVLEERYISKLSPMVEKINSKFPNDRIIKFRDETIKNYGESAKHIVEYLKFKGRN